jgi:DNA-binding transcriptional ArsR family regulator
MSSSITMPEQEAPSLSADTCEVFSTDERRLARVRPRLVREDAALTLAETFRALGDPTRVRILDALAKAELCVCEIATLLGLSESAVSHQLRLLRGLRVVRARRQGRMVIYALDDHHIKDLFAQGLRHVQEPAAPPSSAGEGSRLTVERP